MTDQPGATAPVGTGRRIDVCNGDADGLCAVLQWRLAHPAVAELVTGLKREIELLERVQAGPGDEVLVCDLSMQRNASALARLLEQGARVHYFDHHVAGRVPDHGNLRVHLDFGSLTCTSLLMDRHLRGEHRAWALVGAYGDNLGVQADQLARDSGMEATQCARLRALGEAINHNAYGETEEDVCIPPRSLYALMARHADPLDFAAQEPVVAELESQRRDDLQHAGALQPHWQNERGCVLLLPDAPWSRRVIGGLANERANAHPRQAQAVLKPLRSGDYVVSVRAPRSSPHGASALCERFGGAGRASAAGIDRLPASALDRFVEAFAAERWAAAG